MFRRLISPTALGASLLLTAGVLATLAAPPATARPADSPSFGVGSTKVIVSGVSLPWGVVRLPDGSGLLAERDSFNIIKFTTSGAKTTVGKVSGVSGTGGEGGLLGLALSPSFSSDHWLYVYHTASGDNRIVRIKYENDKLGQKQTLLTGIPRSKFHNGGRIAFGPDGNLYAGTGDAQNTSTAQNLNSLGGKIVRIAPDGSIPSGNPFPGKAIYSYGHRNVQGLAWDSQGRLWSAELGASSKDELNRIQAGKNYGWPTCEGSCSDSRFVNPVRTWSVAEASPSGIAIVNNVIYMAALRGERLWEMTISGNGTSTPKQNLNGTFGRLRTVIPIPGGDMWLSTSNGSGDRIVHVDLT